MSFLFPLGLAALATLPLILFLHLLDERRRRVQVPSLLLWMRVPRRFEGERSRRLPLTLLLLLHLLAAALLALALARPQIPGGMSGATRHIAILIDTSTSMAARDGTSTRLARAQGDARGIVAALGPGDRATVIALGQTPRIVASGGAGDGGALAAAIDALQPGGTGVNLDAALTLAEAALDPQLSRQVVIISDGALQSGPERSVGVPVEWRQVGGETTNRAITAFAARAWGRNPQGGPNIQVYARVANYSGQPYVAALRLYGDDRLISTDPVSIPPGGETELTWRQTASYQTLRAEIDGGDALPLDDAAFIALAPRALQVLVVSARPEPIERALAAIPGVRASTIAPVEYASAATDRAGADMTIFDGFLPDAWPEGATLAINPQPGNPLLEVAPNPLPIETRELTQRGVTQGLSLGGVSFGDVQQIAPPAWATTQLAAGQVPLVLRGSTEGREVAIWTFDLARGNLPGRLAFPLLMARTVRDLAPPPLPPAVQTGEMTTIRPGARAEEVRLVGPGDVTIAVPAGGSVTLDGLTQPGFYRVEEVRGGAPVVVGQMGVNAGSPVESNLEPRGAPLLRAPASDPGGAPVAQETDLWPWLALAALAVLGVEWLYILLRGMGARRVAAQR